MTPLEDMEKALNERPLEDNYPTHIGYLYVVGGKVFQNWPAFKTVKQMRDALVELGLEKPDVVITNCDISGRKLWDLTI